MPNSLPRDALPLPFRDEVFEVWRQGIYDDAETTVFVNARRDFAVLYPQPVIDYDTYVPRLAKMGVGSYAAKTPMYHQRLTKVSPFVHDGCRLLEIGAGDGTFLRILGEKFPGIQLATCEKDVTTKFLRTPLVGKKDYADINDILGENLTFDIVCLFHVLEHLLDPVAFLDSLKNLSPDGKCIIEVPALTDPLLSLYQCDDYEKFYFQKQHPFVYSQTSLCRLLEYAGFVTDHIVPFQRYPLSNHLQWLSRGIPGGNALYDNMFSRTQQHYIADLERAGLTDSVIWIGSSGA